MMTDIGELRAFNTQFSVPYMIRMKTGCDYLA